MGLTEGKGVGGGEDALGAGGVEQGRGGGADAETEGFGKRFFFVKDEETAGGEGVARSGAAGDESGRDFDGGLPDDGAIGGRGAGAFGKVDDGVTANAEGEKGSRGLFDGRAIKRGAATKRHAGELLGLVIVGEEQIDFGKNGRGGGAKAVGGGADAVERGEQAGGAGGAKDGAGARGMVGGIGGIERVEEQEVAEVEPAGGDTGEIEMGGAEQGVRGARMEKRAATGVADGHDIGVAGRGVPCGLQTRGVDAAGGAVGADGAPVGVVADEPQTGEGKGGAEFGEVLEDVVGASTVAGFMSEDVGETILSGPRVDGFDVVDDPVAGGEESGAHETGWKREGGGENENE